MRGKNGFIIALITGAAIIALSLLGLFENSELDIYDRYFQTRGVQDPGKDIIIVAMDEKSVSALGPLPWSRDTHARMLQKLSSARVTAMDVLFDESRDEAGDRALAKAIADNGQVVLTSMFTFEKTPQGSNEMRYKPPAQVFLEPSAGTGYMNMASERGNMVRKVSLYYPIDNSRLYPCFSLAAYLADRGLTPENLSATSNALKVDTMLIPTTKTNQAYIQFWGPGGTFPTYSYIDVLQGNVPEEVWRDKIVFIGVTTPEQKDYLENPFTAGNMVLANKLPVPGVEIHASALKSLETGMFYTRLGTGWNLLLLLFTWLLAMGAARNRSPWRSLALTILLTGGLIAGIYWLWSGPRIWVNLAAPLIMVAAVYVVNTAETIIMTNLEKRRIRNMFGRYVSPEVVKRLVEQRGELQLGGVSREISIMFCDIRGFTRFSEGKPAHEIVDRLNEFFTKMTDIVFQHGGTLDKYLGDGMMVLFGAPVSYPDHARRAVQCAIDMLAAMQILNEKWEERGESRMEIGLGINSGQVVVGNVGSSLRMEYTAIGEDVNLASRLEALNKEYHTNVMISPRTLAYLADAGIAGWRFKSLGTASIRGLNEAIELYTLISAQDVD